MHLDSVFYPKSIAIVGASTKVGSVGNDIVKNLATRGYEGKIFPVNPKATELYNLKCYPSLKNIEQNIDLVIVVVPAPAVPQVMEEAAAQGAKGAIIISAGFKEAGNIELENQIREICQKNDIALVGPNCLGVINTENKMNASFAMVMPDVGTVAFLSQSGALCAAVLDYATKNGIGFSKFMSLGNKAVMGEAEILEYLSKDKNTKVVAMYAEQLNNPVEFIAAAKKLTCDKNPKPIIVIKSGRTSAGASASASHTGALAGNDAAYDALFNQSGIIRVYSVSELFEYVRIFTHNQLPKGNKVAIITNAGGPGVLTTDEATLNGLEIAKLSPETEEKLMACLPSCANVHNPIDILGDAKADRYASTLEIVSTDKNVDMLAIILTPQSTTEIEATAEAIIKIREKTDKPIVASFIGGKMVSAAVEMLQNAGVAVTNFPEQAAKGLAVMANFIHQVETTKEEKFKLKNLNKARVAEIFAQAKTRGQNAFPEMQAMEILEAYGFPLPQRGLATNAAEAEKIAKEIGMNVVLKIASQDILHKSDVGGVMVNVTQECVVKEFTAMLERIKAKKPNARIDGVLISQMAPKGGTEVILGINRDANLGHLLMVGLGGIYVELFKDVAFGLAPIDKQNAQHMVARTKLNKILDGLRGGAVLDKESLIDCLGRLSALVTDFPEIKELDVNPLLILPNGSLALDARILI